MQPALHLPLACARRIVIDAPCSTCGAKEFSICRPLDPDRQAQFFALATRLGWERRRPLFAAGDRARHVFNLTAGMVCLSRSLGDGRRQIFGFLLPGDFIGLEAGDTYSFDAETLTEAKACRFERGRFDAFLHENPDVALRLVQVASNDRAQAAQHEMLLGRKTAEERIASFLVDLHRRSGERHLRTEPLALPMTRTEIADYAGLTIETVSRVLGRLRDAGAIEPVGTGAVRLLDFKQLERLAGADMLA